MQIYHFKPWARCLVRGLAVCGLTKVVADAGGDGDGGARQTHHCQDASHHEHHAQTYRLALKHRPGINCQ
ncbi:hypothetical protein E2C01_021329 [Portunus trituberculatus]|uniref:Secreted protein n=1 Tax=Portunus trituberculatus TaxID=210409 RepID=A0A5B7E4E2_PORTR|nr:hypothetical protein [Portunus trituberculatus]